MCGISGIVRKDGGQPDPGRLRAAARLLAHRGPDEEGHAVDGPAGLSVRRLGVIDLETGRQPIAHGDKLWVVHNGEIYNHLELRQELCARGHVFQTRSDTEVILALYKELGDDCVRRLRGMFAFALWDGERRRLLLARDRIGEKPLVYADTPGYLAFASELRALFVWPGLSREIEPSAIDEVLSLQYIPAPRTIYRAVRKLPPGHLLIHEDGHTTIRRYWDLPVGAPAPARDPHEAAHLVREKVKEAVRLRMIADVPVGAFLSGGVDSTVVVGLMSSLSDKPVRTFSIGFEEPRFSELPYAREVARRFGCDHTEIVLSPRMADLLPKLAWHYGEPYADTSALPLYCLSREARRAVTVVLTGDGGDEDFGGYIRHFAMKAARLYDRAPRLAQRLVAVAGAALPDSGAPFGLGWRARRFLESAALEDGAPRYLRMMEAFTAGQRRALYSPELRERLASVDFARGYMEAAFAAAPGGDLTNTLLHVDLKTFLPEDLLVKLDIAAMAHGLEGRSPLLDHELVELAYRMPGAWKLKGLRGHKWIFKEAFKDELPPPIARRSKMGFDIPVGAWLRGPLRATWEERVLGREALGRGYFDEERLRAIWSEHQSGRCDHGYGLWALMMLELWHEASIEGGAP